MTSMVSVERGEEAIPPWLPSCCTVRARFVMRRSSWESWLQAKHRLMTGLSRPPLSQEKLPPTPGIEPLEGEGDRMCSRRRVGWEEYTEGFLLLVWDGKDGNGGGVVENDDWEEGLFEVAAAAEGRWKGGRR